MMPIKFIQSAANPELKHLAKLIKQSSYRRKQKQVVLEGIHLLQTFIDSDWQPVKIYVSEHSFNKTEIKTLLANIDSELITLVADGLLSRISSLSEADELTAIFSLPEIRKQNHYTDVVILEDIQDPGNVGTILRSCAAVDIKNIILSQNCADIWSPKVLRAAMGAHAFLYLEQVENLYQWCENYNYPIYATVLHEAAQSLYTLKLTTPAAWIFGNEGSGVSSQLSQFASEYVIIPMAGKTESLNVAMAASVCLFEQQRQRMSDI